MVSSRLRAASLRAHRSSASRICLAPVLLLLLAGSACLPEGEAASGPAADGDGDGVADELDNCSARANPTQLDSDGDHFGNACDPDYDENERVGLSDFNLLRSQFGMREGDPDYDRDVDHSA